MLDVSTYLEREGGREGRSEKGRERVRERDAPCGCERHCINACKCIQRNSGNGMGRYKQSEEQGSSQSPILPPEQVYPCGGR